jgi:hypothetical protein
MEYDYEYYETANDVAEARAEARNRQMTRQDFIEYAMNTIDCTYQEATQILAFYRKHNIIKCGAHSGLTVIHGEFLDADILNKALHTD